MKNIYILGTPRSGKTTLIKNFLKQNPEYNHISFEALRNAFTKTLPELKMNDRNSVARTIIMPEFIVEFSKWNNIITGKPSIIDYAVNTNKLANIISEEDIIICLGHGLKNIDEITENIKKYSKEGDYTYRWEKERIKEFFYNITENDNRNYQDCKKYNIKYYDTSLNRDKVIEEIIKYLMEINN